LKKLFLRKQDKATMAACGGKVKKEEAEQKKEESAVEKSVVEILWGRTIM